MIVKPDFKLSRIKKNDTSIFFFFSFSLIIFFEGGYLFSQNESSDLVFLVLAYVFCAVLLESIILLILSFISKSLFVFVLCIALASNIFFLKLAFFNFFQALSDSFTIILIIVSSLVFLYLFRLVERSSGHLSFQTYFFTVVVFIMVPFFAAPGSSNITHNKSLAFPPTIEAWKHIKFKDKPNIHLISFDSMIPTEISGKYLNIWSIPYMETINANMLQKIPAYSPRVPTRDSLNSIMNLDQTTITHRRNSFSGKYPSLLTFIARNNGYKITTGFSNYYFGKKGPYIDNHEVNIHPILSKSVLCVDVGTSLVMRWRLFDVCSALGKYSSVKQYISVVFTKDTAPKIDWPEKVLGNIRRLSHKASPQITFHYIYKPIGHTPSDYRHNDAKKREAYRSFFMTEATKLDKILRSLVTLINKEDPNSLVMVFGDHGAYLNRGVSSKDDPDFVYLGMHAIALAVLKTDHVCASEEAFHYSQDYATPSKVLTGLFRCLAADPVTIDRLVKFIKKN